MAAAVGGKGATFKEAPVESALMGLISECTQPGAPSGGEDGSPNVHSVDEQMELVSARSGPTGGGYVLHTYEKGFHTDSYKVTSSIAVGCNS